VHSAAIRMVNDPHLAKDVSQGVFVALAKDAGKPTDHPVLSGWLHLTTRNIAAQTVRIEVRRRTREKEAAAMNEFPEPDASWEEIAPHLDAALAELSDPDRDAVLLRYFENKSAKDMAATLGINAEAAQRRVSRAVERLRENLAKRGITAEAAGLAGAISAHAVQVAPVGLAVTLFANIFKGAAVSTAISATQTLSMNLAGKALAAAVLTLLAGAGLYLFTRPPNSPTGMTILQPPLMTTQKPRSAKGDSLIENMARTQSEKPPVDRKKELERLKQRWLELKPKENAGVPEQDVLAKESAKILLSGPEAVELLRFLKKNELWGETMLEWEIANVFATSQAADARAMLTEIADTKTWVDLRGYKTDGDSYRETWSKAAGKSCPDEEFESFCKALNSASCAQEALFGRNERLFGTDPVAALTSTLGALEVNVPSDSRNSSLYYLFQQDFPADVDFEALEKLLPIGNRQGGKEPWQHLRDPVLRGREQLLVKWAKADPVAASNHVLANPDRCSPKMVNKMTDEMSFGTDSAPDYPTKIRSWVEQFGEGPYYDEAADQAVWKLAMDHPDEALRLASRMSDPKRKKSALQRVDKHQKIKRGEASFEDGH
jgi:RNA polymerase sigma factor (sigma-70 family)